MKEQHNLDEAANSQSDQNVIGNHAQVKITSLPNSSELTALVDTGATLCCLHADKWKIVDSSVQFTCKQLSANVITLPLITQMSVKSSDGGTEYRPVVELNIRVNGRIVQRVQFNLNNRSHMDNPVLLGANFLKQAKMMIDPNMTTESDEVMDHTADEEIVMIEPKASPEQDESNPAADIARLMMNSNITLADLIKQIQRLAPTEDE